MSLLSTVRRSDLPGIALHCMGEKASSKPSRKWKFRRGLPYHTHFPGQGIERTVESTTLHSIPNITRNRKLLVMRSFRKEIAVQCSETKMPFVGFARSSKLEARLACEIGKLGQLDRRGTRTRSTDNERAEAD